VKSGIEKIAKPLKKNYLPLSTYNQLRVIKEIIALSAPIKAIMVF